MTFATTSSSNSTLFRSISRRSVSTTSNNSCPSNPTKSSQSQQSHLNPLDDNSYYPIGPSEPSSPYDAYISRYCAPSQHDEYILSDHHHTYTFCARPTETQACPPPPPGSVHLPLMRLSLPPRLAEHDWRWKGLGLAL